MPHSQLLLEPQAYGLLQVGEMGEQPCPLGPVGGWSSGEQEDVFELAVHGWHPSSSFLHAAVSFLALLDRPQPHPSPTITHPPTHPHAPAPPPNPCRSDNDRGGSFAFDCGFWRSYYRLDMDTQAACANYQYVPVDWGKPDPANLQPFQAFMSRLAQVRWWRGGGWGPARAQGGVGGLRLLGASAAPSARRSVHDALFMASAHQDLASGPLSHSSRPWAPGAWPLSALQASNRYNPATEPKQTREAAGEAAPAQPGAGLPAAVPAAKPAATGNPGNGSVPLLSDFLGGQPGQPTVQLVTASEGPGQGK